MSASTFSTVSQKQTGTQWAFSQDFFAKTAINQDLIIGALDRCNISYTLIPTANWPPKDREVVQIKELPPVDLFSSESEVVWKNRDVQVVVVHEGGRYHLLVKPAVEVEFEAISDPDYVAIKQKMKMIPDVFERVFGVPDFCEQIVESKTTFGFEVFPAIPKDSKVVDLLDKDIRNLYMLTRGQSQSFSIPSHYLEKLKEELKAALDRPIAPTKRMFTRERTEVNMPGALTFRVNTLATLLMKQGAPVLLLKASADSLEEKVQDSHTSRPHITTRCLFCNVPDKEIVYKGNGIQILVNPKPYVGWTEINIKHVIVAPIEHREDGSTFTRAEVKAERDAILKMRAAWKQLYPGEEFFAWRQFGILGGQTVPHLHWQILCGKVSEIFQYYHYMVQDIIKVPPLVFPPNVELKLLLNAVYNRNSSLLNPLQPWNDQIIPLSAPSYYRNRFQTLASEVAYRFEKYFEGFEFPKWRVNATDDELKDEFLKLAHLRGSAWFDTNATDISRAWRKDFKPAFDLIHAGVVRNPNCIAFEFNKLDSFNGSLVDYEGMQFIAMEAPDEHNTKLFFYALHDTATPLLVRLTPAFEKGTHRCAPYWEGRTSEGKLQVPVNILTSKAIDYLASDDWEDGSAANVDRLLGLVSDADAIYDPSKGPLGAHCSAGVGRTGTFIVAFIIKKLIDAQLKAGIEIDLSIARVVAWVSLQRYAMVSNAHQYINLYRFAQKYIETR